MSDRIFIRDLEPNKFLKGVYAIQNCQLGLTRGGKPFIKCLLSDRTGRAPGRMWNASEELFQGLPTEGFVFLEGQTQPYQGEMQIIIQQIYGVTPTPTDLIDLLPHTSRDVDQMFAQVQKRLAAVKEPSLKAIAKAYLDDQALMERFRMAPAAMNLHHAFIGGLLEHTLNLMNVADAVCAFYPELNAELVLVGLFLHDLGKCAELAWETGFGYTDDGQLIGHVARGAIWLEDKARQAAQAGTPIPRPVLMVLQHIILSHHGQAEFGAAKLPSTPEAIAVSILDNLDAKMQMAIAAARQQPSKPAELGGHFTEKMWALDTRLYRPDPTKLTE